MSRWIRDWEIPLSVFIVFAALILWAAQQLGLHF